MAFRIGQKVVFVGGGPKGNCKTMSPATIGAVYTVREIDDRYTARHGHPGIRVAEVVAEPVMWCGVPIEPCWLSICFRPVVEHKTDISIFTQILDDVRAGKVREIA